ncbi:MAG: 2-amino-4-hydroxy-6-hydroxymethyldihydropteridine diphosphokinase [Actinomycetota bacterium]
MAASAYAGLGSNLGDRLANLRDAVLALSATPGVRVQRSSSVYETSPVGGPEQGDFLNAVVEISTDLEPHALLKALQRIENELGRVRAERFGPRTIDLDLLLYGDERIDEPDLIVPHPRMRERAFVVVPLLELEAAVTLPDGDSLEPVTDAAQVVRRFAPPLDLREG